MVQEPRRIGEILKHMGLVTDEQIEQALEKQKSTPGRKLAEILMDMKLVKPVEIGEALMKQWEERVNRCEQQGLIVRGIRNMLGHTENIYDLQKKLADAIDQLSDMKDDLESLYQVCVAIARDRVFSLMGDGEESS